MIPTSLHNLKRVRCTTSCVISLRRICRFASVLLIFVREPSAEVDVMGKTANGWKCWLRDGASECAA
ncbi:hypothetical protein KCP75_08735 [Salmonella enterica subsp. enterica]|nr:hypothetical protein KCP75_08735 [Salmonella enterica subsp. enterica]